MKENWKSAIPDGQVGGAKVETFDVDKGAAMLSSMRGSWIVEGTYKRLFVDGVLMMSDTPSEYRDHSGFLYEAKGNVLINGLGLGCCLAVVLAKESVDSVTVIEKSQDVIDLIAPHFTKANIICADALEWTPPKGERFDAVWHDIWPHICEDNLPEMHRLHRRYGRRCDWQGSWARADLEYQKRRYG